MPLRTTFEPRFQHDFSRVRVHREGEAGAIPLSHGSLAAALGSDITLAGAALAGDPVRSQRLIAHELAHVVQSERGGTPSSRTAVEQEAHVAGERVAAGGDVRVTLAAPPGQALHAPPELAKPALPDVGWKPGELTSRWYTLDDFDTKKADLKSSHLGVIDEVAKDLARDLLRGGFITVIGHADAIGPAPENKVLGQQRADAVRSALIGKGVPPDDVRAGSLGMDVRAVDTPNAEAKNRRVEIVVRRRSLRLETAPTRAAQAVGPVVAPQRTPGTGITPRKAVGNGTWREEFEQSIRDLAVKTGANKNTLFDAAVDYLTRNNAPLLANEIADLAKRVGIDRKWAKEQVQNGVKKGIEAILTQGPQAILEAIAGPPVERQPFDTGPPRTELPKTLVTLPVPFSVPGDKPAAANPTNATVHVTNQLSDNMTKLIFKRGDFISFRFTTPSSFTGVATVVEIVPKNGGAALRSLGITGRRSGSERLEVPDSAGPFVLQVTLVSSEPSSSAMFHFSVE